MIILILVLILLAICFPDAIGALIGGIIALSIIGALLGGLFLVVVAVMA